VAKLHETIRAHENALERLTSRIPGFRGYRDREARREADKLLREHGARELERIVRELHEHAAKAALDELEDVSDVVAQAEKLTRELRFADRGYSGFFDEVKLDSAEALDAVYERDERVVAQISEIAAQLESGELRVPALRALLKKLGLALADRRGAILGLGSR
jgi:hypothetical protein